MKRNFLLLSQVFTATSNCFQAAVRRHSDFGFGFGRLRFLARFLSAAVGLDCPSGTPDFTDEGPGLVLPRGGRLLRRFREPLELSSSFSGLSVAVAGGSGSGSRPSGRISKPMSRSIRLS